MGSFSYLKVLRLDRSYIDLLQPDIYEAIKEDLEANKQMAVYLDYSKEKNCELLQNYDIYSVYWILKNCIYGSKEITELKWNKIRICVYIINKKQLSLGEWIYLTSILKHIENNPLYYELLYAVLYMDYSFVKSTFDKIYVADKSDLVERYLQELRPESFFNELLSRMKNSQDREERNRSAFNLLMYYPDKRKIIANEAVQLNDDGLLFEIEKVAEQETMPEVTEIVGKAIVQKQNLNNYPKYIICPNDGNRVQCLRTTKLRGKDGEKCFLQVFFGKSCRHFWRMLHLRFGESCNPMEWQVPPHGSRHSLLKATDMITTPVQREWDYPCYRSGIPAIHSKALPGL